MEILIGINPDTYDDDAMALGSLLARSFGGRVALAYIYPVSFDYPGTAHVDAEWVTYLREQGSRLLEEARERFMARWDWDNVEVAMAGHPSSGIGLAEVAKERGSSVIVVGSAPGAPSGRFAIGSTANRLLHASTVPVATAPAEFAREEVERIGKIVVAFQIAPASQGLLDYGLQVAQRLDVPLTVLTVLLRHRVYGSKLGADAEGGVLAQLREDARRSQDKALAASGSQVRVESRIAVGQSTSSALASEKWSGDELLMIGSASRGPLMSVFLGDMTHRLLRSSPVPALIVPRTES